jgi:hypothetical protein
MYIIAAAVAVVIIAEGVFFATRSGGAQLSEVYSACKAKSESAGDAMQLAEDGKSLEVASGGNTGLTALKCIQAQTNMPSGTMTKIGQSSPADGQLTDSWGSYKITWSDNDSTAHAVIEQK